MLVTVIAAVLPARRAARVAPVAAMRGDAGSVAGGCGRRGLIGLGLLVAGAAGPRSRGHPHPRALAAGRGSAPSLRSWGCWSAPRWRPAPSYGRSPGRSSRSSVPSGRLARENALRVPRRTATTASALMIGLALIAGHLRTRAERQGQRDRGVANELTSDFVLNSGNVAPVPTPVAAAARALPGVRSVAAISAVDVRIGTFHTTAYAAEPADVADNFVVNDAPRQLSALRRTLRPRRPDHRQGPQLAGRRHPDREPSAP